MKTVKFTEMKHGTKEDYILLDKHEKKFAEGTADRLLKFMKEYNKNYLVDTKYCDFFGKNNCSFPDSIFKYIELCLIFELLTFVVSSELIFFSKSLILFILKLSF